MEENMIECKLCGHQAKYRLIEHIQKTHKMDIEYYKNNYGPVITEEYKDKVSKKSLEKWQDPKYRENVLDSRIYDDKWKQAVMEGQQKFRENNPDFKVWNTGLTKETDERLKHVGEVNKEKFTGRTKENYEYLKKHSDLIKSRYEIYWGENGGCVKFHQNEKNNAAWKDNISKTITEKIKNGEILCNSGHFKTGYYKGIYYHSGWELEVMQYFDSVSFIKSWETNFDVVNYIGVDGKKHRYLPDFKVITIYNDEIIIEVKGYIKENDKQKALYASQKYKNYFMCYSIQEVKDILNEIIKNK